LHPKVTETIVDPAISETKETPQVGETQLDNGTPNAEMAEGGVSPMKSGRYEIHEFDVLPSYKVLECDWNMIREESSRCPICSLCPVGPLR